MQPEYELLKDYKDVLTPDEVRKILGIGKNKMYALLRSELLPSFKIGSNYKITKSALIDYLQNSH